MTLWAVSSQVMKHGFTNTTLKRSDKVHNGRLLSELVYFKTGKELLL